MDFVYPLLVVTAQIDDARARRGKDTGPLLDLTGGGAVANTLVAALW